MAMQVHFCMGEKTGADFYVTSGDTCGRCGMKEKKGGCCNEEQKFIKLSEDHQTPSASYCAPVSFEVLLPSVNFPDPRSNPFHQVSFQNYSFTEGGPPLYLSNCVFLI